MRIVVTGGAGFIGSNLCRDLVKDHEVVCVDDFSSGRKKNVKALLDNESFELVDQNIIHGLEIEGEVDGIYHLASRASPPDYQHFPIHTMRTNAEGTFQALELAKEKDAKLMYSSTSEVYGDPEQHPQKEDYNGNVNTLGPRACYDESKRYAETLIKNYSEQNNIEASIVRIFNTYGPQMKPDDGRVITNFLQQAIRDEDLTIYGDGSQTRAFCYIDDMIKGMKKVMDEGDFGPYNVGNPEEITIKELAEKVQQLIDTKSELTYQELPEDDPSVRKPDITKIKQLGWESEVSLKEGLIRTRKYIEREIDE